MLCSTLTSLVNGASPQLEFAMGLSPVLATACGNPDTASTDLSTVTDVLNPILAPQSGTSGATGAKGGKG